jgi:hypothetical protein
MALKLPVASATYSPADQAQMRGAIERADAQNLKRDAALPFVLLSKPDGSVGKLTVDNLGALHWTAL